jgi:serine phosphatase RsbU (regulator of sigma subunit)
MRPVIFVLCFFALPLLAKAQNAAGYYRQGMALILSKPDSANHVFERAVLASEKEKNDTLLAQSLQQYGKTFYEISRYGKANEQYNRAFEIFKKLNRQRDLAELEMLMGQLYLKISEHETANTYFLSAKKRFSDLNDLTGQLRAENNIGILYFEKGDLNRARQIFFDLRKKTPSNDASIIDLTGNLAIMYYYDQKPDSALYFFHQSYLENKKAGNTDGTAVGLNNMGHALIQLKDMDSAKACFARSADMYRSVDNQAGVCLALGGMAQVHHRLKQYDKAAALYTESFELSTRLGLKFFSENTTARLAALYAEMGNYKEAYTMMRTHVAYRDSTNSEKSDRLIEEMQARFNVEIKQKEIDSLQQQKTMDDLKILAQQEENKKRSYVLYAVAAISVLILGFAIFAYSALQNKKKTNQLLTLRNLEIAQQNKEIRDSINYAKHIQEAILPPDNFIRKLFPKSFVFYKPKDIVSGDFYWVEETESHYFFAAVDCTGHGVPGAFMSIVAHNGLLQAVNIEKLRQPAEILNYLSQHVNAVLHKKGDGTRVNDGMDIALCAIDKSYSQIEFAGAYNPLVIVRNSGGEMQCIEIPADKQPVGHASGFDIKPFTNHKITLEKGDNIFVFSDGYADQFGGNANNGQMGMGKKFKYTRFKQLIQTIAGQAPEQQKSELDKVFENWKGDLEQLDDICIMGIQV